VSHRSSTCGLFSTPGASRLHVLGAVIIALAGLVLSGCSAPDGGDAGREGTQPPGAAEPTEFPFDPELSLSREQHEEMRSCIVTKLGMPIEDEDDEERAGRAFVVCGIELGHEDVYWPDADAQARRMLREVTVDGEPSFLEQLSPFS